MSAHAVTPLHVRAIRREHGFTMIELVVGMILLGIVGAIIVMGITGGVSGYQDAKSNSDGMAQAAEAAERFGTDLRVARSQGRSGPIISPSDLQLAIDTNGDLTDIATGRSLDWRDVYEATPSSAGFQADVIDEPGVGARPECVRWFVQGGAGSWQLRRTVRSYTPQCAGNGAMLEDDAITKPNADQPAPGAGGTPPLFTFVASRTVGTNCSSQAIKGTPTPVDRNRIVSVRLNFRSLAGSGATSSNSALLDEVTIRSRAASDYQFGLRCTT